MKLTDALILGATFVWGMIAMRLIYVVGDWREKRKSRNRMKPYLAVLHYTVGFDVSIYTEHNIAADRAESISMAERTAQHKYYPPPWKLARADTFELTRSNLEALLRVAKI